LVVIKLFKISSYASSVEKTTKKQARVVNRIIARFYIMYKVGWLVNSLKVGKSIYYKGQEIIFISTIKSCD